MLDDVALAGRLEFLRKAERLKDTLRGSVVFLCCY